MHISGVLSLIVNFLALEFAFSPNVMLPAVAPRKKQKKRSKKSGDISVSGWGFIGGQNAEIHYNPEQNPNLVEHVVGAVKLVPTNGGQASYTTPQSPSQGNPSSSPSGGQSRPHPYRTQQNRRGDMNVHNFIGGQGATMTFNAPITLGGDGQSGTAHQASTPTQQNRGGDQQSNTTPPQSPQHNPSSSSSGQREAPGVVYIESDVNMQGGGFIYGPGRNMVFGGKVNM